MYDPHNLLNQAVFHNKSNFPSELDGRRFDLILRWDDCQRDMGVMHTVMTDTSKERASQCSNTTGTHDNKLRFLVFRQFTNDFSGIVAFLFVQLEIHL